MSPDDVHACRERRRRHPARERIPSAAYDLFSQRGIQAVGIDAIVERTGVAPNPAARLMAIFDVFDEWFHTPEFEGSFINVMLEHGQGSEPLRRASTAYLTGIRDFLEDLARAAEVDDPEDFARRWHILMKGSIVAAGEGDTQAGRRAQQIAGLILREQTQPASSR